MASHFFLVFLLVTLTISNGTLAADTPVDNKSPADNSTKGLIDSLGPSQEFPDYDIPKELAPGGVEVVPDYVPMSPNGGGLYANIPPGQPEEDLSGGTSTPSAASRSSSTVLTVVAVAAAGGASLFFF